MLITIIIFVAVLSLLVFVHEVGHFVTARKFGARVDEFGLGLPPRIFGFRRRNGKWQLVGGREPSEIGETIYSLNWIPIGGFVKIKGENGEAAGDNDSFAGKKIWQRALILAAGVLMNFLLCAVLLSIGFMVGIPGVNGNFGRQAIVSEPKLQITEVVVGSPAQEAGIAIGDILIGVDDQQINHITDLQQYFHERENKSVVVKLNRNNETINQEIVIRNYNNTIGIGVGLLETVTVRYPWYLAWWQGLKTTALWLVIIIVTFAGLIRDLFVGQPISGAVAGPVGIAVLTGQMAELGWIYVLQFTAMLSLNLAIINILPFPALDGGRLVFLILEKVRGRAVKQQLENLTHNIGFLILLIFILVVTYQDLLRYGGKIIGLFSRLIGR